MVSWRKKQSPAMCCKPGPEMEIFDSDTFSATTHAAARREPLPLRQALVENGTAEKTWLFFGSLRFRLLVLVREPATFAVKLYFHLAIEVFPRQCMQGETPRAGEPPNPLVSFNRGAFIRTSVIRRDIVYSAH